MKIAPDSAASEQPPKLLDQLRRCLRGKHYSPRTERVYVYWARWYIRFHQLRYPADMGVPEIHAFLSYLSNERSVSTSTHHQALCALLFLYKHVLKVELPWKRPLWSKNIMPCMTAHGRLPPATQKNRKTAPAA